MRDRQVSAPQAVGCYTNKQIKCRKANKHHEKALKAPLIAHYAAQMKPHSRYQPLRAYELLWSVLPDCLFTAALVRKSDFANQDLAALQPRWLKHFPARTLCGIQTISTDLLCLYSIKRSMVIGVEISIWLIYLYKMNFQDFNDSKQPLNQGYYS